MHPDQDVQHASKREENEKNPTTMLSIISGIHIFCPINTIHETKSSLFLDSDTWEHKIKLQHLNHHFPTFYTLSKAQPSSMLKQQSAIQMYNISSQNFKEY